MLEHLMAPSKIPMTIADQVESPLRVVERIGSEKPDLVLISHLPPDGLTAARYLVRRIKARHPQLTDRGRPLGRVQRRDAESDRQAAQAAVGASAMLGSLAEARDYLVGLTSASSTKSADMRRSAPSSPRAKAKA